MPETVEAFADLALSPPLIAAINAVGYESPTAIQARAIPSLLEGRDLIGHAQTGTGKTAAFALPILEQIALDSNAVQALVLTPTRELAIQVAEAFQRYAAQLRGFHVAPIYGGQAYPIQLRALDRGCHVVVGTPGRVMDHMRRGTLNLAALRWLVLDEADEMLRMGFIEDVEWVLSQLPESRQTALFSATMPPAIRAIAKRYLRDPVTASITGASATADTVRHRYCVVNSAGKLAALTRLLEAEPGDGVLIFVRTRIASVEVAERLEARGFACAAINGDMPQKLRERAINQFKRGQLDLLVATDVAARGLDVDRVTHVINYDMPYDAEVYVHRIGRTGRAGRHGEAILFATPREQRMLRLIEKTTRQRIERMDVPTAEFINHQRQARFVQRIGETLAGAELDRYVDLVMQYQRDHEVDTLQIAAALACMAQAGEGPRTAGGSGRESGEKSPPHGRSAKTGPDAPAGGDARSARRSPPSSPAARDADDARGHAPGPPLNEGYDSMPRSPHKRPPRADGGRQRDDRHAHVRDGDAAPRRRIEHARFRIGVGREHGVQPGNIVGAIAAEGGLDANLIGRIEIHDQHSIVELPLRLPSAVFEQLRQAWVCGRQLRLSRAETEARGGGRGPGKSDKAAAGKPRKKDRHRLRKDKGAPRRQRDT